MSWDDCGSVLLDIHHLNKYVKALCSIKRNTEGSNDEPQRRFAGRPRIEDDDDIEEVSEDDDIDKASDDVGTDEVSNDEDTAIQW